MKRFFYLGSSLDELEVVEAELKQEGLSTSQIHSVSYDDAGLDNHQLNQVHQWFQTDVVQSTMQGALIGLGVASAIVTATYLFGLHRTVGVMPFAFMSVVVLGFCTWEAGFIGTQRPNRQLRKFQKALSHGRHLLALDVPNEQESAMRAVLHNHPRLHHAGIATGAPAWRIFGSRKAEEFVHWAP